jgi:tellurite resistance protein TerC
VPAIFAITTDPFIVYTSNIFAILGLRSMFFALAGLMHMFRFLKVGLSLILVLIGLKLCFLHLVQERLGLQHVELAVLGIILSVLLASVGLSVLLPGPPGGPDKRRGPEGAD